MKRHYLCELFEVAPPPRREGLTYVVVVTASGRHELQRKWAVGPLRLRRVALVGRSGGWMVLR